MKRILTLALLLFATIGAAYSQGGCYGLKNPTNFSLYPAYKAELGSKTYAAPNPITGATGMTWSGNVLSNTQIPVGTTANCTDGRYRIMSSTDPNDPNTGGALPVVPTGFTNSIRIGNCNNDADADALYYDMTVTPENVLLQFYFAIVSDQDPPGHGLTGDPTFVIRVLLDTTPNASTPSYAVNQIHHDSSCYMITSTGVTDNVNGWHSYGSGYNQVFYRDWHMACINLYDYLYRRVRIEVMISDCAAWGHYGYCYFVGDCKPMTIEVNDCYSGSGDTVALASVPSGMGGYQWYRSKNGLTDSIDLNNYTIIPDATDSVLAVRVEDFISEDDGDILAQNTFLCQMTTYMDPAKPMYSKITATVNNMKPMLRLDSLLVCNSGITLWDRSTVAYTAGVDSNNVDTSRTEWAFYETEQPMGDPVYTAVGGRASYEFATSGLHSVVVRSYTYYHDMCWNEKTVNVRTLEPLAETLYDTVCQGDDYANNGFTATNVQENDTLTQQLTTSNGCDSTVTLLLTVMPTYNIVIDDTVAQGSNYFSSYGFEVIDAQESDSYTRELTSLYGCDSIITLNLTVREVGIETVASDESFSVKLYPNPADENVTLHVGALPNDTEVTLCDAQGRMVLVQTLKAGQEELTLNIRHLAAGSYHVRIVSGDKAVLCKLVKR